MKHHTRDIGERVAHIADREAEKYYRETGGDYFKKWLEIYGQVLKELAGI